MLQLSVPASLASLPAIIKRVEQFAQSAGLNTRVKARLTLICEELFVNTVEHNQQQGLRFELQVETAGDNVKVMLRDNGAPFNLLEHPLPTIRAPLEEREPGGLGIHLTRSLAAQIAYVREADWNTTSIVLPCD